MILAERVIETLKQKSGLSDRQIADELLGKDKPQQSINIVCRSLESKGILVRRKIGEDPIKNYLTGQEVNIPLKRENPDSNSKYFSEDAIKEVLEKWLVVQDWKVKVAWGRDHGVDIEAIKENRRWLIEVKGHGSRDAMRVNYFLGILGEMLQRMEDSNAKYSIALPDIQQFRNLWTRLPLLAKSRTGITAIFVTGDGKVSEIR